MRSIAREVGCSVASPYQYFKSHEELMKALIQYGESELKYLLRNSIQSEMDTYEKLGSIARAYFQFASENKALHKIMFNTGTDSMHRKALPQLPTSYRFFLATLREGFINGEIKYPLSEYRAIARMMWAWIYGLIILDMTGMLKSRGSSKDPIEEGIAYFKVLLGEEKQLTI
jgi:AcrR family transcriptional regulator